MFVSSRTFYGGDSQIPQTVTFSFPFPERVEVYSMSTSNATKWDLQGWNGSTWITVDSRSLQHKLYPSYTCSNPGVYSLYRFVVYQVSAGNKVLYISTIKLTNQFGQTLHPNLNNSSNTYTCVIDGPSPLTITERWYNTSGTTTVTNGPVYTNSFAQSNINANVVCANLRYAPPMNFTALVGSKDGGRTWTNVLALNTTVSSNLSTFNSFRLVGDMGVSFTKFEMYDPDGNIINEFPKNPARGGAYRGSANTAGVFGEWIEAVFDQPVAANSYEFYTATKTNYPSAWTLLGSTDRQTWTTLHSVSNVYDHYDRYTAPFVQGSVPHSTYRFIVSAYQGRAATELIKFNLYDDRGYELIPTSQRVRITSNLVQRPTNVLAIPPYTVPALSSPFIENQVFVSLDDNGQYSIDLGVPVSVHKVYTDTDSTFSVVADNTGTFTSPATLLTVNTLSPSGTYSSANTYPFRYLRFQGVGTNKYMSNVALFNRDGGRINPYMSGFNTVSSNTYGGRGQHNVVIQLTTPNVYSNAYSVLLAGTQSLAAWTLESNVNGTWQTVESTSNVYNGGQYYQNTFTNRLSTGTRLTIHEIAPHKEPVFTTSVVNLNLLGNVYTSAIPYLTQNTFTVSTPGPLTTTMPGQYKIRTSTYTTLPYRMFDDKPDTFFEMGINPDQTTFYTTINDTDVYGDWIEVETPFPVSLRYFTFTTSPNPNQIPNSWTFVGSQDRGLTWSNVLSEQTRYFTSVQSSNQTNVFPVSNTTASFTNFRFIIRDVYNGSVFSLSKFALFSNTSAVIPTFSALAPPANYYAWSTLTDTFGGTYVGNVSTNIYTVVDSISNVITGEWIQIQFPVNVSPSFLRVSGNVLPTTMYVCASREPFRTTPATFSSNLSYIVGNVQYNFNQTRTMTIPLTMPTSMQYFRIIGSEMFSNTNSKSGALNFSEISFLNSRGNRIHQNFTPSDQTDPLSQLYVVNTPKELGGEYQTNPETIESNLFPSYMASNSYVFRSVDAKRWIVEGSTDYTTWDTLDTREVDEQIVSIIPRAYQFYYQNQTGRQYAWYRLTVTHTFKTTDGRVRITEFAPIDYKHDRILKYTDGSNAYTGGTYNGFSYLQTQNKNYYGEYKIFTYERPTLVSNIALTYAQDASIKGITFLGKNTEPFWNVIPVAGTYGDELSAIADRTIIGTYQFSGSTISNPSNAFTTSTFCILGRAISQSNAPYVQIELPIPSMVNSYEISVPTKSEVPDDITLPTSWYVQGSLNGSGWTTIAIVSNDLLLQYGSINMYTITPSVTYKYYKFVFNGASNQYSATIKQITLYNGSYPLYLPKIFTREKSIQLVESAPLYRGPYKLFEFETPVAYSNIAFVVNRFTNDPYVSTGKLSVVAKPDKFVLGSNNYSIEYAYNPTDIVESSNAQSLIFYNETFRNIKPSRYSFVSNTANSWSMSVSNDGKNWVDWPAGTIGPSSSWFRLTIDKATNVKDGTVDISQFRVYDDEYSPTIEWPPAAMRAPTLVSNTILQTDSYGILYAIQSIQSSTQ